MASLSTMFATRSQIRVTAPSAIAPAPVRGATPAASAPRTAIGSPVVLGVGAAAAIALGWLAWRKFGRRRR